MGPESHHWIFTVSKLEPRCRKASEPTLKYAPPQRFEEKLSLIGQGLINVEHIHPLVQVLLHQVPAEHG